MKRFALAALVAAIGVVAYSAFAGWQRQGGTTTWVDFPTDATCWARDNHGDIHPVAFVKVDNKTIKYVTGGTDPANTTYTGTGYWHKDGNGDYMPINCAGLYEDRLDKAGVTRVGIEWELDSSNDLMPKD